MFHSKPKICYMASPYQSHSRVAHAYRDIIRTAYEVVADIRDADIVILHEEPLDFGTIYERNPDLANKYVIAYCVWESDDPPAAYKRSIALVQEVWTCSHYCMDAFQKYHPKVTYVPHIIARDRAFTDEDSRYIADAVSFHERCVYYFTITKFWDKRKNTPALVEANKGGKIRLGAILFT